MICPKCKENKNTEEFYLYPARGTKKATCRVCTSKERSEYYVGEIEESLKLKNQEMKLLLKEIIDSCDCNNGRRLRMCIEKARVAVGRHERNKVGGGY